uniref:hypothetical protein n=2 Tax=Helicobacteraceae TaxID=72293 RepID=UPI003A840BD0
LLQFSDCFNSLFYQENNQCKALRLDGWRGDYRNHFAILKAELMARKNEDFNYKDSKFGFTLSNCRPYHFFYFALMYFESLNVYTKKIANGNLYFYSHKIKEHLARNNEEMVCLQPYVRETAILPFTQYAEESLKECFANNIFHQALASKELLIGGGAEEMYSLTLWLGIPGERRIWLEQWEGIPLILKNLSHYFPSIKVYVDGMTAYDGERIEVKNNLEAFWKIVENTKEVFEVDSRHYKEWSNQTIHNTKSHTESNTIGKDNSQNSATILGTKGEKITLKSLSGYDYRTKICYCAMCDIVISETSTTALTPFDFCKKPGVAFYCIYEANNMVHINMARDFAKQIPHLKVPLPKYHAYEGGKRDTTFAFNYHFPPEHFYNLAAESLEELSKEGKLTNFSKDNPLKMHRLAVPSVELYAKKHALEQKTKIKISSNKSTKRLLKEISYQKQLLEIESLELDIQLKQLQIKSNGAIPPLPTPNTTMQATAKDRIHNHLAYKLGAALILNSKSLWGYIRMPYVLSYIKESHKKEILEYEAKVAKNPSLKLPKLESYPDHKEALKEKECFTYKLGEALMQADKDWIKGGYLRFYFQEVPRLKKEFREKRK